MATPLQANPAVAQVRAYLQSLQARITEAIEASGVPLFRSADRALRALRRVEAGVLTVGGVDAVDGTPVYDVKPYLPWCEAKPEARSDWAKDAPPTRAAAMKTIVGRSARKKARVAAASRRSSSAWLRSSRCSQPARCSRRTRAEPTRPR